MDSERFLKYIELSSSDEDFSIEGWEDIALLSEDDFNRLAQPFLGRGLIKKCSWQCNWAYRLSTPEEIVKWRQR
tara:strand:- start:267 stop:488 length:222 start_codon:yes stop_codon:yes gene_type:complete